MSRGERKAMIVRHHPDLSLSRRCRLLSISRSSFYYALKGESSANLALMRRIDELFLKYPFYGSRQMARQLRREGVCVGRHRVRRLMLLMVMGLQAIYQALRTSAPHPAHRVYSYLLKGLAIDRNRRRVTAVAAAAIVQSGHEIPTELAPEDHFTRKPASIRNCSSLSRRRSAIRFRAVATKTPTTARTRRTPNRTPVAQCPKKSVPSVRGARITVKTMGNALSWRRFRASRELSFSCRSMILIVVQ